MKKMLLAALISLHMSSSFGFTGKGYEILDEKSTTNSPRYGVEHIVKDPKDAPPPPKGKISSYSYTVVPDATGKAMQYNQVDSYHKITINNMDYGQAVLYTIKLTIKCDQMNYLYVYHVKLQDQAKYYEEVHIFGTAQSPAGQYPIYATTWVANQAFHDFSSSQGQGKLTVTN